MSLSLVTCIVLPLLTVELHLPQEDPAAALIYDQTLVIPNAEITLLVGVLGDCSTFVINADHLRWLISRFPTRMVTS
eukprot:6186915-Amphidinium_carterae.1